jgi:hypothetical protein
MQVATAPNVEPKLEGLAGVSVLAKSKAGLWVASNADNLKKANHSKGWDAKPLA